MKIINNLQSVLFGDKKISPNNSDNVSCIRNKEETYTSLLSHPIFEELRGWSTFYSKVMTIDNRMKKNMAEYYVKLLFKYTYDSVYYIVVNYNNYINEPVDTNNLLINTLEKVNNEASANGVPSIFLDKVSNYLYNQLKILGKTYVDIHDTYYTYDRVETCKHRLDMGLLMSRCITSEIENVINEMNGELSSALIGSRFDK